MAGEGGREFRRRWGRWMGLAATVVLLTLSFPPFGVWPLIFFAIAPMTWVVCRPRFGWRGGLAAYGAGVLFWLPNLWWLAGVTSGGFVALALFMGLYFALYAFAVQRLVVRLRWPAAVAAPVAWVAIEYLRSVWPQGGFAWFLLGNAAAPAGVVIQAADLLGVWGVSFLIAAVNGLWVDLLRMPRRNGGTAGRTNPRMIWAAGTLVVMVAAWMGYGVWRLEQGGMAAGPRVAVLQGNVPQSVKDSGQADEDIFDTFRNLTVEAGRAAKKPDLIVWPETMVPLWTNPEFTDAPPEAFAQFGGQLTPRDWAVLQDNAKLENELLQATSDQMQVPLLLGVEVLIPRGNFNASERRNRVELMEPGRGGKAGGVVATYDKIHLVPFGEYLPWRTLPIVGKWMLSLSPYPGEDYSCTPGTMWTRFELRAGGGAGKVYTFGTPICFEDTMPEPGREMVKPGTGPAAGKADFLVSMSNDGWFPAVQLDQHLQATQLRAVEERVWMARSVNTGNSGFVDSCGRVVGLVRGADGRSAGAVGWLAMNVQIDPRVTLYSVVGDVLPVGCGIVGTLAVAWAVVRGGKAKGARDDRSEGGSEVA